MKVRVLYQLILFVSIVLSYSSTFTHTILLPMRDPSKNGFVNTMDDFKILGTVGKGTYGEVREYSIYFLNKEMAEYKAIYSTK